ncbi:MAG: nucleotide exchange factor GrpE [Elusimicrobia bacterium]|nr:nucleotide exchange factor GrpE [Elusimicrobiota bacterium]
MSNPKANPKESCAEQGEQPPQAPEAAPPASAAPAKPEESPEARLKAQEEENAGIFDQLLRLKAEFENYRKRMDRDKPQWERHGRAQLLSKLLPLYDVLLSAHDQVVRRGEALGKAGEGSQDVAELMRGLEMIFKEFTKLFESEGVQVIESVGKPYDFNLHEVVGRVETDEKPEDVVVEEIARGYIFEGKVLRPAQVRVAAAKILEDKK